MEIYLIANRHNGKVYIGQTSSFARERWRQHIQSLRKGREGRIYSALRKWGVGSFEVSVLRVCHSKEEMNSFERLFIVLFRSTDRNFGYNISLGGDRENMSEETKQKISLRTRGRTAHNKGKRMSQEQRDWLSRSRMGKIPWNKGIKTGPTGIPKPGTAAALKRKWQNDPDFRQKMLAFLNRAGRPGVVAWNKGKRNPHTHCHRGHELSTENAPLFPSGRRNCKTCARARYLSSKARH